MANATVDNKPQSVDELSALFDEIEVGSNLDEAKSPDYGSSVEETLRPFADKVADVRAIMEPEPPLEEKVPEVIARTIVRGDEPVAVIEPEPVAVIEPEPEPEVVIEPEVAIEPEPKPFPGRIGDTTFFDPSGSRIQEAVENGDYVKAQDIQKSDNPLELSGENLRAYKLIQQKYPQFQLHGTHIFNEFYRYKVQALKIMLTRYGLLPLTDMKREIENIKLDRRLGPNLADPVAIGQRMDDSIAYRGRVASLLAKAQSQLPAWKKTFEWLNSKVQKDYELKGAHKRDGLALEHNADMKDYYSELQGFVDAATTIDSFLKSQHDSYSRQLSCVDMREKVGVAHDVVASEIEEVAQPEPANPAASVPINSELDGLDILESGTLIEKVPVGGLVEKDFPGAEIESEFLDGIG